MSSCVSLFLAFMVFERLLRVSQPRVHVYSFPRFADSLLVLPIELDKKNISDVTLKEDKERTDIWESSEGDKDSVFEKKTSDDNLFRERVSSSAVQSLSFYFLSRIVCLRTTWGITSMNVDDTTLCCIMDFVFQKKEHETTVLLPEKARRRRHKELAEREEDRRWTSRQTISSLRAILFSPRERERERESRET